MSTPHLATALHQLPTRWADVTLAQAADLSALPEGATVQDCLALLLGCAGAELLHLSPQALAGALGSVLFLSEPAPEGLQSFPRVAVLTMDEVEVPVPDVLEDLTFGQAADIGAAIRDAGHDVPRLRIVVAAIILQPAYDGMPYDSDRAQALEAVVGQMSLAEALPLTDFFLPSSTGFDEATPPASSPFLSAKPSGPPTSAPSVPSGTRWPSWMRWPAATKPAGTTSTASSGPR
ncbi:hypothetical protein D0N36_06865 [Hymenobacter lapidiphilus]|uniref:hypothetical protein n=1 Tax=Hymenobacter sp. CCM 8763 TaxID=2303334 RepID=UPI000E34232F|nr:hypothetical protein [Hymenobacter sp. CCM 8763]RFP65919.1 hypothetical protein D0N36_06865 [Hymenobacter sp. CCM 8763]